MFGLVSLYMVLGHEVIKIGLHNIILADSNINKIYYKNELIFTGICKFLCAFVAI